MSITKLQRQIRDEKLKITDERLFASSAFSLYLTKQAVTAVGAAKKTKRMPRVYCYWDSEDENLACTDNRAIRINAANSVTQSFPTRALRADSLVGMNAHEIGHILFTDFTAFNLFLSATLDGRMYPVEPKALTPSDDVNLREIQQAYLDKDIATIRTIAYASKTLFNIFEDIYIEARMCTEYSGIYRTGILLNSIRMCESIPSITKQIEDKVHDYSIIINMILQYCRSGDINNLEDYTGEYLDAFNSCVALIDPVLYDDDIRSRFMASNQLVVHLWKYLKNMVDEVKEMMTSGKSVDEAMDELCGSLDGESATRSSAPKGSGRPLAGKKKWRHDAEADDKAKDEIQDVVDYETERMELEKTDSIDTEGSGGVTYDFDYAGAGYDSCVEDMHRILNDVAYEDAVRGLEEDLSLELQEASDQIRYGNAHKDIPIHISRMRTVPPQLELQYSEVWPELAPISKQAQLQVMQILKDRRQGGKLTGLMMGKRLNPHSFTRNDGHFFYNRKLPVDKPQIAVGLLVDESGSMSIGDRITKARAAALVLYDFCQGLEIPAMVYGHTEDFTNPTVHLFAYAEFESVDGKDKFRMMDMSSRSNNRDGAALRYVGERLLTRDEEIRILIILSDGQPAANGYWGTEANADLRGIAKEYENKGIKIFAGAIGDDKAEIESIYGAAFLDLSNLKKLPANLTKLISRFVKQG